ncbi:MAG: DNA methyltransferase [Deltaproteobacteria bacterium]
MHKQKIFVNWKPLLWFVKGSKRRNDIEYVRDLVESTPPEKALHEWAKPVTEAAYYIKHLTLEGDTVMDPMMGSGTTGVVAINLKRKFIGIEIAKERFEIGKKRIMRDTSLSSS